MLRVHEVDHLSAKEGPMQIQERSAGAVKVLDLSGPITFQQGDTLLKDKVHSLVHQGQTKILVNMAGVPYMDSAGLGQLVALYTTVARAGGSLKLENLTTKIHDLLTITKLLTVFETFDAEQDAVAHFR
jgi:anti-sigma B factor antagonist